MHQLRRIGELARDAGVPTSTIRFYERRGLLPADTRSPSRYRLYGQAALERLRFIRLAQSTGFTLDDIAALLDSREELSRAEVQEMLSTRLKEVQRRLLELGELKNVLQRSLDICSRGRDRECCPILQNITTSASTHKKTPQRV